MTNLASVFFFQKFSHYMLNSNLIERLEARANGIASALNGYSNKSFDGGTVSANVLSPNSFYRTFLKFLHF